MDKEKRTNKDWWMGVAALAALLLVWYLGSLILPGHKPTPSPPPAPQQKVIVKPADPVLEKKKKLERLRRLDACARIESSLLRDGYDVQVIPMSDNDANLAVVGPGASRLLLRQMAASGIGKRLKNLGVWKVTFMRDRFTWVGEWDVIYGKIEAPD